MFAYPDVAQVVPVGGTAVLFAFMLKIVWGARTEWAVEKQTMKTDWATEKADLIAYNNEALVQMQANCVLTTDTLRRLHVDELASLNRRIDALEAEVLRGRQ